jgi:hypothetical protein
MVKTYVALMLLSTFASSFIWGINTLFLLDAGLSITAAFAANAFFTVGMVLFELPTGIIADTGGGVFQPAPSVGQPTFGDMRFRIFLARSFRCSPCLYCFWYPAKRRSPTRSKMKKS